MDQKKIGPGWKSSCTGSLLRISPCVVMKEFSSMFSVPEKNPLLSKSGPKEKITAWQRTKAKGMCSEFFPTSGSFFFFFLLLFSVC